MEFSILKKEEIQNYLDQIDLTAYADSFARFAVSAYQSERFFVGLKSDGQLRAFLPIFIRNYRGQKVAETPIFIYTEIFFTDSDFFVDGRELGKGLLSFLQADILRLNLYNLNSRTNLKTASLAHTFTAMIADLQRAADFQEYLKNVLSKNARSKIYKSYQGGLEFVWLTLNDLPEFYRLYTRHADLLGSRPHSLDYFQKMLTAYEHGQNLLMMGVKKNGQLIAASLFVANRNYLEVRFLADERNWRHLFPNNFLYAELIKWAYERQIRWLDFGGIPKTMRSNIDFKKSLGAKEYPIYTKYFYRNFWQKIKFNLGRKLLYWTKYRKIIFNKF